MNAIKAIERSKSHNEIIHLEYDAEQRDVLLAECDGSVVGNKEEEFWRDIPIDWELWDKACGVVREQKMLWRVHMAIEATNGLGY